MITKHDIQDEAKRRILDLVGGHRGGDLALKTMRVLLDHAATPNNQTRAQIHGVRWLIDVCNRLEKSLIPDYQDDKHWVIPPPPVSPDRDRDELARRVVQLEQMVRMMQAMPVTQPQPAPVVIQHMPMPDLSPVTPRQLVREPDLETAEVEAMAEIMASVEAASGRLPIATADTMAEQAAKDAAAMRTAQTLREIETIRDGVLAYIAEVRRTA